MKHLRHHVVRILSQDIVCWWIFNLTGVYARKDVGILLKSLILFILRMSVVVLIKSKSVPQRLVYGKNTLNSERLLTEFLKTLGDLCHKNQRNGGRLQKMDFVYSLHMWWPSTKLLKDIIFFAFRLRLPWQRVKIEISHNLPVLGLFMSEKDLSYEPHCIKTRQLIFLSPEYSKPSSFIFPKTY